MFLLTLYFSAHSLWHIWAEEKNLLSVAFVNVCILLPHILCWPRSLTGECYSILKCTLVITHEMIVTCTLQVTCVKWFSKTRGQVEGEHVNNDFKNLEKKKNLFDSVQTLFKSLWYLNKFGIKSETLICD